MSNFGAYWLGALVGLIFAVALAATLSIVSPMPGDRPVEIAAAPAPEPEPTPEPAPAPEPEPAPAPEPAPEPEPEPEAAPEPEPEPEPETAETSAPAPAAVNALRDNSERYRGDESQPLLSIVLVDLGDESLNVDEIFLLPAPLSIVVNSGAPDAAGLVLDARDAGFEAMLSVDEGSLAQLDRLLAEAGPIIGVAALDGVAAPEAIADLTTGLVLHGMGLLDATADGGGAAYRAAQAISLPAAPGGRRFDENPNAAAVYQALERAAFDARRLGAFVVLARPDAQVMTGLRRWMSVKANKSVAVAPLSTVMRKLARQ